MTTTQYNVLAATAAALVVVLAGTYVVDWTAATPQGAAKTNPVTPRGVRVHTSRPDPMTDKVTRQAITLGENGRASLSWVCSSDGLAVIVAFPRPGVRPSSEFPRYRFPNRQAEVAMWAIGRTRDYARLARHEVDAFTKAALESPSVLLEFETYSGDVLERFDLAGLANALETGGLSTCKGGQ